MRFRFVRSEPYALPTVDREIEDPKINAHWSIVIYFTSGLGVMPISRRKFVATSGALVGGASFSGVLPQSMFAATQKEPSDFIVVEGHRDIWEFTRRLGINDPKQWSPLRDFIAPRLIAGGYSVVIMPCAGDSIAERGDLQEVFVGAMRTLDMLLCEVEKSNGKVSIIRTKADVPTKPARDHVQLFLDMEGGAAIQPTEPEPGFNPQSYMALLRQFFRLGMRGLQLTHNERNALGQGVGEGHEGQPLSEFGAAVVKEMNALGMMVGVSHLSGRGLMEVCQISNKPVVSTHQNVHPFLNSPIELNDDEEAAIAKTGGIVGVRYIEGLFDYKPMCDEIEYLAKKIGPDHIGIGWLGHDVGNPDPHYIPGYDKGRTFTGREAETMRQHWEIFLTMLSERGFTDEQIGMIAGGNYVRIWKEILPDAYPSPTVSPDFPQYVPDRKAMHG
jgi:membrane dipeptidase